MGIILTAESIYKSFSTAKNEKLEILKGVSLELEDKKLTLIIGKSTLLHILSGLDKPDTGTVKIKNENIFKMNDERLSKFRNKNIGFVFQFHHLLPEFTALENTAIPLMIKGDSLKKASVKAAQLLELVGLQERLSHKPAELSGGEQQRVAVARALANEPSIIFADEPTGNLDSKNSEILHELFLDLQKKLGLTFLMVTHNPELVRLGERILEMKDGKLEERNF